MMSYTFNFYKILYNNNFFIIVTLMYLDTLNIYKYSISNSIYSRGSFVAAHILDLFYNLPLRHTYTYVRHHILFRQGVFKVLK